MSLRWVLSFIAAVAVIMMVGVSMLQPMRHARSPIQAAARPAATTGASRLVTLEVGGMVCSACEAKIEHQLSRVAGVQRVEVDFKQRKAQVLCSASVADSSLIAAVRRAGPQYLGLIFER